MSKKKSKKNATKLPNKVTEEEFLRVLENISQRLGHKFKFGYHSYEDMKQQAAIFALEGLEKYDNSRPLENFLWTHVRNRLFNYKRDNYQRPDKPCIGCPFFDSNYQESSDQCKKYSQKLDCSEFAVWHNRNNNKKNIMKPVGIEDLEQQHVTISQLNSQNSILEHVANEQILDILDREIPAQYRSSYLKLKNGDKIYKTDLKKLTECIKNILKEHNYDN